MAARYFWLPLVLAAPVALAGPPDHKQPHTVVAVVESHFARWDKNRDGKLSREEIDAAVGNSGVTGEEAAAAAALHVYFRNNAKADPLTLAFVADSAKKSVPAERRDLVQKSQHFQSDYERFRNHIRTAPHDLFTGAAPHLKGMSQGALGDCYFVSVVGAAVYAHRQRVLQMFRPAKDGACELDFPDGTKVLVRKLTDAQIALGSTAGEQGLWLNVLEEGFGQVRFARTAKKQPGDIPLDVISRGGDPATAISLLTGHKTQYVEVLKHANDHAATGRLRTTMIASSKARLLMDCGTPEKGTPPGIPGGHCYAVLGFDAATDTVHLWNPWGNTFQPKHEPHGLQNGYPVKDGRFDVPLGDFVKIFGYFDWETHEPLNPAPKK